jgi:Leucine-rich repeat (LRR) protein
MQNGILEDGIFNLSGLGLTELPPLPDGIEILEVTGNKLTYLPPLPVSLKELYCGENKLVELPPLPNGIELVNCANNNLKELPRLPATLSHLDCAGNHIEKLPSLPPSLLYLNCSNNRIWSLPEVRDSSLVYLYAYNNQLTEIPLLPPTVRYVGFDEDPLSRPFYNLYTKFTDLGGGEVDEDNIELFIEEVRKLHIHLIQQKGRNLAALSQTYMRPGATIQKEGEPSGVPIRMLFGGPERILGEFLTGKKGNLEKQRASLLQNYKPLQGGRLAKNRYEPLLGRPYRNKNSTGVKKSRKNRKQRRQTRRQRV